MSDKLKFNFFYCMLLLEKHKENIIYMYNIYKNIHTVHIKSYKAKLCARGKVW